MDAEPLPVSPPGAGAARRLLAPDGRPAGWSRDTMSVPERRDRPAESVAGLMAAASIAVSAIGVVHTPVRTIPLAILVALIALAMGGRHRRLAAFAVFVGAAAFVVGMTVAVARDAALW